MNEPTKNVKLRRRNDIFLIALLLLVSVAGIVYLFLLRGSGDTVKVLLDGEVYGVYPLSEERTEEIRSGGDGRERNCLIIHDGKAYMESASCPDGICVAHRPIFRDGESIVCLPNRVVVTVITEGDSESPDIVG